MMLFVALYRFSLSRKSLNTGIGVLWLYETLLARVIVKIFRISQDPGNRPCLHPFYAPRASEYLKHGSAQCDLCGN